MRRGESRPLPPFQAPLLRREPHRPKPGPQYAAVPLEPWQPRMNECRLFHKTVHGVTMDVPGGSWCAVWDSPALYAVFQSPAAELVRRAVTPYGFGTGS